ncbi:MAG: phosphatidylserine decarboxylase [Pirellulales bacterium]
MSHAETSFARVEPEPLAPNITSVQPGGGVCYQVELAWGRLRRRYLRTFRPRYVERMAQTRRGDAAGCPHDVLDPRDLKYCRNLCTADWDASDDPFQWRERLPFARWGLAELGLIGLPLLATTLALAVSWWYLAPLPAVLLVLVVWFFRDPPRRVPQDPGLVVAPADGLVSEVTPLEHDEFIGGPAVRIGIFLSIFNVHLNRAPCRSRVVRLRYHPGRFLNAMNPESALSNENLWIGLEEESPPHRRLAVRQIAGLFARRIVCSLRPGEVIERGHKFGMIKLGSRTELILPAARLQVETQPGQRVKAGATVVARFPTQDD